MRKRLLALFLSAFLLSGCNLTLGTEDLLVPPKLTAEQAALNDALAKALGTSSFRLKYPRRGESLSAFVFHDLDRDGVQEAIAFYELTVGGTTSTWMSVLAKDEGGWKSIYDIPGGGSEIDAIAFAPVSDGEADNIIVGWSVPGQDYCTASIYSFDGKSVETLFSGDYNEWLITDVDGDALSELFLCTLNAARPAVVRLVKYRNGAVSVADELPLPSAMTGFEQLLFGPLTENLSAFLADINLSGGQVSTVIAAVDRSSLESISEEDLGIYVSFDRTPPTLNCRDINGDGFVEIPVNHPLPGYEEFDEVEKLYLTDFMGIRDGSLFTAMSVAVNFAEGYLVQFPKEWPDGVTVRQQSDTREWRFVLYDGDLEDSSVELLRIKVVSPADYQDKFDTLPYQKLASKGTKEYYGYIPPGDYPGYSITYEELAGLFSLL